ncbi:gamma-aminobutyric acid receptor subunit pi-like [Tachypleus tridentatus]|uniref:gamma-aminobutyric acid receptor subunit pi-like n=1 Tax=Tachypleus tridentatus TaxID=6853 RepID=UPI003FCF2E1E
MFKVLALQTLATRHILREDSHRGNMFLYLLLLFHVVHVLGSSVDNCGNITEDKFSGTDGMLKFLPENYKASEAPRFADGAVKVYVSMQILDISDIDDENMDFTLHTYIVEIWKDPRLYTDKMRRAWSSAIIPRPFMKMIWKPDLVFESTKNDYLFQYSVENSFMKLILNNSLYRSSRYMCKVTCPIELYNYPLDTQTCSFKASMLYSNDKIVKLKWFGEEDSPFKHFGSSVRFANKIKSLQFKIADPVAHVVVQEWLSGNFTYLMVNFTFIRRLTGSVINTYFPSGVIVILSWVSFWLDVDAAPARVALGITSMLTLVTQAIQSRNKLPSVDYMMAIDVWLFFCIIMVFGSLLEYAVAYQRKIKNNKTSAICRPVVPQIVMIDNLEKNVKDAATSTRTLTKDVRVAVVFNINENSVDKFAKVVFPIIFLLFCVIYWVSYLY